MTVSELMERLEEFDPNAEVRLMTQRHYPYAEPRLMRSISRRLAFSGAIPGDG